MSSSLAVDWSSAHAGPLDPGLPHAEGRLERRAEGRVVVGRHVEVDRLGRDVHAVEVQIHGPVGHGEGVERGVEGPLALRALGRLERQVRELAVTDDGADTRSVEVDLVDGELAGEQGEEPGTQGYPVALDERGAPVARLDADMIELHGEGPDAQGWAVRGDHPLLAEDPLGLPRRPVARPGRPHDERGDERHEADERQHGAEGAREPPPPVPPPSPPPRADGTGLGTRQARALGVGRHRGEWESREPGLRKRPATLAS